MMGLGTVCIPGACPVPTDPMPCCVCGGDCKMLSPAWCIALQGTPLYAPSCGVDEGNICELMDSRPQACHAALFVLVPDAEVAGRYSWLSTAPLSDIEFGAPPQYHRAHTHRGPWMCNRWNADGDMEYHNCGYALNINGALGDCVPEGYAGLICDWREPCPN